MFVNWICLTVNGDEKMTYELTNKGFRARVGSYEIEMFSSGVFEDDVKVKRNGKELFTIAFQNVSHDHKIYPVMIINDEHIDLETIIKSNYPGDDELSQEMYFNELYAYILERLFSALASSYQAKITDIKKFIRSKE